MKKNIVKLVITGPVNSGKTTLIRHISDTEVIGTDELATDEVADVKTHTTVAMDHGILYVDDGLELHLYGTPGQRRFDFMWDILSVGAAGIIYLVDGSNPESVGEMEYIFRHYEEKHALPGIIGVTKQDLGNSAGAFEVSRQLGSGETLVMACDPREKRDSKLLVLALLEQIMRAEVEPEESEFF